METLIYSIRENGSNRLEISESEEKYLDSMDSDVISNINLKYNLMPETMFVEEGKSNKEKEHSEKSNKNFFSRLIKICKNIISVGVISILSLSSLPNYSIATRAEAVK